MFSPASPAPGIDARHGSSADTVLHSPQPPSNQQSQRSSTGTSHGQTGQQMAPGTLLAARYRIVAPIGRGGMGQVYRAEDLKLGETVALKFLPESLAQDSAWLGRFFMEVRTAREVTHPNVCRVHDVVETTDAQGRPLYFLTMEYVDGENLADLVKRFGRLPTEKAMEIAGQITAALAAAHEKGVLHRDIKPANVMIDGRGQAKLADFGLAVASNSVPAAEIAGTPGYIAPEILRNGQATGRSDLYSLGLVLYELLTGRKAVKDGKAVTGSVRQYAPEVSTAAEKAVMECLDADPAKRPASAMEVLRAFPAKNALEAALARGETPSPEMVADSADEQPMALRTAWLLVAAVCLGLMATWLASRWGGHLEVKPPQLSVDEMRGKAQEYLHTFGYASKGAAQLTDIAPNLPVLDWTSAAASKPMVKAFGSSVQGSLILTYLQSYSQNLLSTRSIETVDTVNARGNLGRNLPDSQFLRIDSDGDLLAFSANPEGGESPAAGTSAVDWTAVQKATGVEMSSSTPAAADFTPPYAFDERRAWTAHYPGHPESSVLFEATAWHGRLDYLQSTGPWDKREKPLTSRITELSFEVAGVGCLLVGALLAVFNLRRKRGDVKSATRLAIFAAAAYMSILPLMLQHGSRDAGDYVGACVPFLGASLVLALFIWAAYIAIEPLTRKKIPQLLIASSLILQGRWRSPRVGREILLGTIFGVASAMWWQTAHALEWGRMAGASLDVFPPAVLGGFNHFLGFQMLHISDSLIAMSQLTVLCTLLMLIFRSKGIVFILLVLADIVQEDTRGTVAAALIVTVGFALAQSYLLLRVGVVAVTTIYFVSNVIDCTAWTHDWGSWMLPEMIWSVILVLAITGFGFWLAIGNQRPFGDFRLEE